MLAATDNRALPDGNKLKPVIAISGRWRDLGMRAGWKYAATDIRRYKREIRHYQTLIDRSRLVRKIRYRGRWILLDLLLGVELATGTNYIPPQRGD